MVLDQCGVSVYYGGVNLGLNFLSVKAISASLSAPAARLPREQLPEVAAILQRAADDIAQEVRNASA